MSTIIAGRFAQEVDAQDAITALAGAGFTEDRIAHFFVSPPGQHATFPIGGDRDVSPGAEEGAAGAAKGAAVGAAVGLAVGLAAAPLVGPVAAIGGAGVGAYTGSLVGTLANLKSDEEVPAAVENAPAPPVRDCGVLVAVSAPRPDLRERAIDLLRSSSAQDIEIAEGTIADGQWTDFDPLKPPFLVEEDSAPTYLDVPNLSARGY